MAPHEFIQKFPLTCPTPINQSNDVLHPHGLRCKLCNLCSIRWQRLANGKRDLLGGLVSLVLAVFFSSPVPPSPSRLGLVLARLAWLAVVRCFRFLRPPPRFLFVLVSQVSVFFSRVVVDHRWLSAVHVPWAGLVHQFFARVVTLRWLLLHAANVKERFAIIAR